MEQYRFVNNKIYLSILWNEPIKILYMFYGTNTKLYTGASKIPLSTLLLMQKQQKYPRETLI